MKRTVFLIIALLFSCSISAQNRPLFFLETFDSDEFPSGWTIEGEGQSNWSIRPSNMAGGEQSGELRLYWSPSFDGTTRFVSPAVDLTGIEEIIFSFKGCLDNWMSTPHQLGIATTSDNGVTWNVAWEDSFSSSNQGQHNFVHTVSTSDMGQANVKFCIFYTGDTSKMTAWYFDDIEINAIDEVNLGLIALTFPNIVNIFGIEENNVSFTVKNTGLSTVESFEACYKINGTETISETFNTDLSPNESGTFVFSTPLTLLPGTYTLETSILTVNGGADAQHDNLLSLEVNASMGSTQRIPLIEHFSSSTCGPCVPANTQMANLTNNNLGKFAYVKYPINLPGAGDPYCTDDVIQKRYYYSVSSAPHIFLNGISKGSQAISQQDFDGEYNKKAYVDIKGAFDVQGNIINIYADVIGYINIESAKLFVSVNEKTTTGNVGTNGETEFHHVMMKLLDSATGNATSLEAGVSQHFEFSFDMSETNVEEMNDLEVAVWLQNDETKEVYNSHFMYEYSSHPYAVEEIKFNKKSDNSFLTFWEAPEQGIPTSYNVYVNNNLVMENTEETSYLVEDAEEISIVKVVANYDNDMKSVALAKLFNLDEAEPCLSPANINAATEQNETSVLFSWDAVDGAVEYAIYLDGEFLANTEETSYETNIDEDGEHYFSVATICESGESEQSEAFSFEINTIGLNEYESRFEIYPNPAEDFIIINTNENISGISIYNVMGIKVMEEKDIDSSIDVSKLNSGLYIIKIKTDKKEIIKQFIK